MAEKWDESANDSPEVVYEGFSPPATTHSQGMITASSSFVTTDGSTATYMATPTVMENQGEGSHHEEVDRARLCFVCCNPVSDKNFESVKTSMNHSHAPLLVLLTDVLGYKLEEGRLHSQVVCKACYHLLDIIDELQQTLTESKTDVRTKFLETVQKLKLKYPRTDKMLKPRCLRCIQMSQSSARKRGRGRGWKGRVEDGMRGRGRGRGGRGRGRSQSNDGSDNDGEGQGVCEGEICKDVLPSKSLHQSSSQGELKKFCQSGKVLPLLPRDLPIYTDCSCVDMDPTSYECLMCRKSDTEVFYQYCESCLTCQGTFVPWGVNVTLRYVGDQCSITQINAQSYFDEELLCILTNGLKCYKPMGLITEFEDDDDDDNRGKRKETEVKAVDAPKNVDKSPNKKSKLRIRADKDDDDDDDERAKDLAKPNKVDDKSPKDCNESTKDSGKSGENNATARRKTEEICADNTTTNTKHPVKKEIISDGSEEEPEYFIGGVTAESDSDTDQDIDEGTSSSSLKQVVVAEKKFPDIGMNVCKPLLKIQKSRRIIPSKHKKIHPHKTLCDEFESILNRPALGKRKIKPTEKVKWLTESCNARRKDTQSVLENKELKGKKSKNDQNDSITVSKDKHSEGIKNSKVSPEKNPEIIEVSPGKRKRKLTEKAKDFMYNLNADCTKVLPITTKGESVKVTVVKGKKTPEKDPEDEQEEEVNDVEEENVNSHKEETNDKEAANDEDHEEKDKESEREDEEKIVVKPEVVIKKSPGGFSRRGRGPGRRKRRSNAKFKYMWDHDFEPEGLIVKTEDGKEIDLSQLSLKNLQTDKMYRCPVCGKEYKSQGGMQYHLATHTSSARYSCSLCSYRTIRHGDLKKHFVIHTGLKPYKCEVCGQEFSTSSSYKRHMRIHSGEKPYKCEVCGKDFRNITTRKQHMILHTGIKNFVCEVCGKSFALKHHYTSHRKRHNGEMPFKCFHCDSAFKTHNAVKTHRKKEHPVEEAERIQQNRLRRKRAVKDEKVIKLEDDTSPIHQVFQAPGDVLEQAMAATVETVDGVHYEYVDVADPNIPLVSKMIKENWNGRDSVVLTITHIEEEEYEVDEEVM